MIHNKPDILYSLFSPLNARQDVLRERKPLPRQLPQCRGQTRWVAPSCESAYIVYTSDNLYINRGRYVPVSVCRGKAARGEAAACRGKAARGEAQLGRAQLVLKKVEKGSVVDTHLDSDHHRNLTTSTGSLLAHAYHVWSTSVNAFVTHLAHRPND